MTISEIQQEIIDEFEFLDDWELRYEHLIQLGKSLSPIQENHKTEEYLIKGCQSKVWVYPELQNGKIYFTANSDAIITKGIVALLLRVLSDQTPQDILDADMAFVDKIGLKEHLSPTRANGLVSMIKQIKLYALAYQTQEN